MLPTFSVGRISHPDIPISHSLFRQPLGQELVEYFARHGPSKTGHAFYAVNLLRIADGMLHSMIIPCRNTIDLNQSQES